MNNPLNILDKLTAGEVVIFIYYHCSELSIEEIVERRTKTRDTTRNSILTTVTEVNKKLGITKSTELNDIFNLLHKEFELPDEW